MRPTGAVVSLISPSIHHAKFADTTKQRKPHEIKSHTFVQALKVPTRLPEEPFIWVRLFSATRSGRLLQWGIGLGVVSQALGALVEGEIFIPVPAHAQRPQS